MEINSLSSRSKENKKDKDNETKSKFLYKFKILNDSPQSNKYMGKCYLVNINSSLRKNFSVDKNKNKLPPITIKERSNKVLNTITLSEGKKIYRDRKFPLKHFISYSTKRFEIANKNELNHQSLESLTESNVYDKKAVYDEIMKKINERYFIKKSTVKYLTSLFFGSYENRDIKYVNLSKIKGRGEREIHSYQYNQIGKTNNLLKNKLVEYKKSGLYNNKEKKNDFYYLNKSYVDKRLKYYRDSKIRKVKNSVNHAIKDVMENRQKNLLFFDNIRKSCDYKYDDLGFINYCD